MEQASLEKVIYPIDHIIDPDGDLVLIVAGAPTMTESLPEQQEDEFSHETTKAISEHSQDAHKKIRMQVSSRKVEAFSPVFRVMLQSGFAEGHQLRETGRGELHLQEDDPEAVLTIMELAHEGSEYPSPIGFKTMKAISTLVDKYNLEKMPSLWKDNLFDSLELLGSSSDNFLSWISISWSFQKGDYFTHSTRAALLGLEGPIENGNRLSVPDWVLSRYTIKHFM